MQRVILRYCASAKFDFLLRTAPPALVGDGHGARRAGADDPPGCHQGSVADPDREDEE